MSNDAQSVPCLLSAWHSAESELFSWLIKKSQDEHIALDILQETFLRALQKAEGFCDIKNRRAWLFRVANNLLNDEWRHHSKQEKIVKNLEAEIAEEITPPLEDIVNGGSPFVNLFDEAPVDGLVQCLPKALLRLNTDDRAIIETCDIKGMSQQAFADASGLSLSATKSRLQRARVKLKKTLNIHCQVRFDDRRKVCCYSPR